MPTKEFSFRRIERIVDQCCKDYELDLEGLFILTEAATGGYLCTPILAALGGASMVFLSLGTPASEL